MWALASITSVPRSLADPLLYMLGDVLHVWQVTLVQITFLENVQLYVLTYLYFCAAPPASFPAYVWRGPGLRINIHFSSHCIIPNTFCKGYSNRGIVLVVILLNSLFLENHLVSWHVSTDRGLELTGERWPDLQERWWVRVNYLWLKSSPLLPLSGTIAGVKVWEQLKLVMSLNNVSENIFLRFLLCFCHKKQTGK